MILTYAIALLQLLCVIHLFKTGRNIYWIFAIIILPGIGVLAYFIVEILPDYKNHYYVRILKEKLYNLFNKNKEFKKASNNLEFANTIENKFTLANQYLKKQMYQKAKEICNECLKGMYEDDLRFLQILATAEFYLGNIDNAKQILDKALKTKTYVNDDINILYARVKEALGDDNATLKQYEILKKHSTSPEATYYHAMFLKKLNRSDEALILFDKIIKNAKLNNRHYRYLYNEWIKKATDEYKNS